MSDVLQVTACLLLYFNGSFPLLDLAEETSLRLELTNMLKQETFLIPLDKHLFSEGHMYDTDDNSEG